MQLKVCTKLERIYEFSHIHTQPQKLPVYDQLLSSILLPVDPTSGSGIILKQILDM